MNTISEKIAKIVNSIEMNKKYYLNLVFMQNSQDFESFPTKENDKVQAFFDASKEDQKDFLLENAIEDKTIKFLKDEIQNYLKGSIKKLPENIHEKEPHGSNDKVTRFRDKDGNNLIMATNSRLGYAGLTMEFIPKK